MEGHILAAFASHFHLVSLSEIAHSEVMQRLECAEDKTATFHEMIREMLENTTLLPTRP